MPAAKFSYTHQSLNGKPFLKASPISQIRIFHIIFNFNAPCRQCLGLQTFVVHLADRYYLANDRARPARPIPFPESEPRSHAPSHQRVSQDFSPDSNTLYVLDFQIKRLIKRPTHSMGCDPPTLEGPNTIEGGEACMREALYNFQGQPHPLASALAKSLALSAPRLSV